MIFHRHNFKPSEKDPEILWCSCGEVKDIHRCIWEQCEQLVGKGTKYLVGYTLRCKICGDYKLISINKDYF